MGIHIIHRKAGGAGLGGKPRGLEHPVTLELQEIGVPLPHGFYPGAASPG